MADIVETGSETPSPRRLDEPPDATRPLSADMPSARAPVALGHPSAANDATGAAAAGAFPAERSRAAAARGWFAEAVDAVSTTAPGLATAFGGVLRTVAFPLIALVVVMTNLPAIGRLMEEVPGIAARLQTFEGAGIKAELANVTAIRAVLPDKAIASGTVTAAIRKLGPDQFERLIRTANGNTSCEYPKAGAAIRRFVALDYELAEMDLLRIEEAPRLAVELRDSMKPEDSDRRRKIGDPMRCYSVAMTDLGQDVKTGITKIVAKTFDARVDLH